MKTSKNLLKIVLAGLLITSVVGVNAEQVCCPAGTVAYCGGQCCTEPCDEQGKCPICPDGGTLGTDNETCCRNGYSYVEEQGYMGKNDACREECSDTEELVNNECCANTSVAQHNDTKECCKDSTPNKMTVLNGTDTYCCPNDKKDFVTDQGECCSQTSSYLYSAENEDCFCAKNPTDSHCFQCSGTCPSDSVQKANSYCMMLTGKDLTTLKQCIDEKVSGITVDNELSSFEFSVSTGLFSSSKKYKVSFALDKMFCGVVDESSLSVTQESGQKVCYADIKDVVTAFSGYMEKIKDKCFNEDIFYMVMDSFIEGSPDLSSAVKKAWSCCKINLLKDKIITSQLNTRLTELLQDCNKGLYCNTSDCMESCCSSYKKDSSGNPIVTQECCEAIRGEYSELSGNQAQCCTGCKNPSSASLNLGDYVKELFGIKTAYADESGMCIISCKAGYQKCQDGECRQCCDEDRPSDVLSGCYSCKQKTDETYEWTFDNEKCCQEDSDCSDDGERCGYCNTETHKCATATSFFYDDASEQQKEVSTACCNKKGGHLCPSDGVMHECLYGANNGCCPNEITDEEQDSTCYECDKSKHIWVAKTDQKYCQEDNKCQDIDSSCCSGSEGDQCFADEQNSKYVCACKSGIWYLNDVSYGDNMSGATSIPTLKAYQ